MTEYKIIRRELLTYGIVTAKDTDPPLSPVGEYLPLAALHHVVGKGKGGGGPVNRKGVRSIRGLNFAVANAAMLSNSPVPPFNAPSEPMYVLPTDAAADITAAAAGAGVGAAGSIGISAGNGSNVLSFDTNVTEDYEETEETDDIEDVGGVSESQVGAKTGKGGAGGVGGVGGGKGKGGKKVSVRTKSEDDDLSESPAMEEEDLGPLDSQSLTDSPMNSGAAKKRGGGKGGVGVTGVAGVAGAGEGAVGGNKRRGAAPSAARRR